MPSILTPGSGNSNSGVPVSSRNGSNGSRSVKNGYSGNLADGSASHGMGMAFGDGSQSFDPDTNSAFSLSGLGDSQNTMFGARKMSFRTTASVASGGNSSFRGPSPSNAVTVSNQGFAFAVNDSSSRMGVGGESNSAFFGSENSLGGFDSRGIAGNSNSGFQSLDTSAPALKRVRSQGSSVSLIGLAESSKASLRRQGSVGSLEAIGRTQSTGGNKRSLQESIGANGKKQKLSRNKSSSARDHN